MMNPSAPPVFDPSDARLEKLKILAQQYEIRPEYIVKLRQLEGKKMMILSILSRPIL
jgi:hypothetical protein